MVMETPVGISFISLSLFCTSNDLVGWLVGCDYFGREMSSQFGTTGINHNSQTIHRTTAPDNDTLSRHLITTPHLMTCRSGRLT